MRQRTIHLDESLGHEFGEAFVHRETHGRSDASGTARNNLKFRAFKSLWARRRISWRNMNSADNRRPLADEVSNGR
jgi:hypothetical protein